MSTVSPTLNQSLDELAGDRRVNRGLHFHSFDNEQPIAFGNTFAGLNDDARHGARNGRAHVTRVGRIRFGAFDALGLQRLILNTYFPRLTVKLEENRPLSLGVRLAHGEKFNDERLAGLKLDEDFFAGLHAIVKLGCGQDADIAVELPLLIKAEKYLRIHQIAKQIGAADVVTGLLAK